MNSICKARQSLRSVRALLSQAGQATRPSIIMPTTIHGPSVHRGYSLNQMTTGLGLARSFSSKPSQGEEEARLEEQVRKQLDEIKDEKERSISEMGILHSLEFKLSELDSGKYDLKVKLKLTKDFRKAKSLIQGKLLSPPLDAVISKVKVEMAPQEKSMNDAAQGHAGAG